MDRKTLRLNDGFNSTNPHLRDEVKLLQNALVKAGYAVDTDGFFGNGTRMVVIKFQQDNRLETDGIVGKGTWSKLNVGNVSSQTHTPANVMIGFRGDLGFIHKREGHNGSPYWPKGSSGITLDPGFDLGQVNIQLVKDYYKDILSSDEIESLSKASGVKGEAAKMLLDANPGWKNIKISRDEASKVFPVAADKYWKGITRCYPALLNTDTPASVQTAYLSLAYNRGYSSKGFNILAAPLKSKNWIALADELGNMQQDHKLEGIRKRRRMEADLIRNGLI